MSKHFYVCKQHDFAQIPGSPIVYWFPEELLNKFGTQSLGSQMRFAIGMITGDNNRFVRYWFEVSTSETGYGMTRTQAVESGAIWFPYASGGEFHKWYGNNTNW